jgi:hypothetical protein
MKTVFLLSNAIKNSRFLYVLILLTSLKTAEQDACDKHDYYPVTHLPEQRENKISHK